MGPLFYIFYVLQWFIAKSAFVAVNASLGWLNTVNCLFCHS
jgi:hypothetical protein